MQTGILYETLTAVTKKVTGAYCYHLHTNRGNIDCRRCWLGRGCFASVAALLVALEVGGN